MVNRLFPNFPFSDNDESPNGGMNFPGLGGTPFGYPNFPGQGGPPFEYPNFPGQMGPPFGRGRRRRQTPQGAPSGPPPSYIPQLQTRARGGAELYAVDPGAIRGCLYRFTYVWLRNGRSFWFFPTYVGRESIAGYRWNGYRWNYYGTDLRRITSFQCY